MQRPKLVKATKHEQRDATVLGGQRLRFIDVPAASEEGPPLVLLHGLASRIEEYEEIIELLRPRRRIIVLDLPGNGYSDRHDRPYSLALLEDAVLALMDHLGVQEADLGGGSLGGNLVLRLGHRAGSRFRRLAPWAPAGAWDPMRFYGWLGTLSLMAGTRLFWPSVWIQSRFWYQPDYPDRDKALAEAFAYFKEVHSPGFVRMYFEIGREQVLTSLFPIAKEIAQPTLLLLGEHDHALGMNAGVKRLVKMLPDARLIEFPDARHSLANEIPEALAKEVDEFLRAPEDGASSPLPRT